MKKTKKKEDDYLKEKRPKFQSLGFGFHDGVYYFGTKVFKDGKGYDSVITSNKEMFINNFRYLSKGETEGFNEIKFKFGLNYKERFHHEPLGFIFDNDAIKQFLSGDTKHITIKNSFSYLFDLFKQYIYFETETKYKVLALYRIAGFFMHVWDCRARLFLHADFGAAKSRTTNLIHNTGFNSINLGDWTPAFMQRIIESTGGEIHIDDFESLDEDKQKATTRLIKVGYMKGFKAGKVSEYKRTPEVFDLFNTTTTNNVQGLDFISADRCITLRIPKIANSKYDQEPNFNDPIFKKIRNELYVLGLKEAVNVAKQYQQVKSDKLNGRLLSIIKPELTIAKIISKDLFEEVEAWWAEEIEQRDSFELIDNWEFRGYEKVYRIVVKGGETEFFNLYDKVVLPLINEMHEGEVNKFKFKMSTAIGGAFSRNPIFIKRRVRGMTEYKVDKQKLIDCLKAKRFFDYIEDFDGKKSVENDVIITEEEVSETASTNSTSSTNSTHSTGSTNQQKIIINNKNKAKQVEGVDGVEPHTLHTILSAITKNYGKSEKNMAFELDIIDSLKGQMTESEIYDWLDELKRKGEIFSSRSGFWQVLK